jgi:hypothetical protein
MSECIRVASIDVGVKKLGLAVLRTRGRQTVWTDGSDTKQKAMVRFICNNCCVEHIENIDLLQFSSLSGQSGKKALYMDASERSDMVMNGLVVPRLALMGLRTTAEGGIEGDPSLSAIVVERQPSFNRGMEIMSESICCTLHMLMRHVLHSDVDVHMMTGKWKMDVCELFGNCTGIFGLRESSKSKYAWNKMASVATVAYIRSTVPHFMTSSMHRRFEELPDEKKPDVCDAILQGVAMMWKLESASMGRKPRCAGKRPVRDPPPRVQRKRRRTTFSRLTDMIQREDRGEL